MIKRWRIDLIRDLPSITDSFFEGGEVNLLAVTKNSKFISVSRRMLKKVLAFFLWKLERKLPADSLESLRVGLWIFAALLLGGCLVDFLISTFQISCPVEVKDGFCGIVYEHSPWPLLTAIGTLPALLLTWYWRTVHKRADIRNTEQGQITERFSCAVDQLGSEKEEVRLGGIYALERIASDSVSDHWTIVETLSAFVRKNCPMTEPCKEKSIKKTNHVPRLPTDIQAALTVLSRRENREAENWVQRIDLSFTNMNGANLFLAKLQRANLKGAVLRGADLRWANLQKADLKESNLHGADIQGARLEGTELQEADLREANLEGVNLGSAMLQKANLINAKLGKACLIGAYLEGAKFAPKGMTGGTIFPDDFDPTDEIYRMIPVDQHGNPLESEAPEVEILDTACK